MLNKKEKQMLITRAKSFAWRFCMVAMAFGLEFLAQSIGMVGLPNGVTVIAGLVLGEVTKELNNRYDLERYLQLAKN